MPGIRHETDAEQCRMGLLTMKAVRSFALLLTGVRKD